MTTNSPTLPLQAMVTQVQDSDERAEVKEKDK
jgi:hypothetical protein